jgi:hypothetical protein
MVTVTKTVKLPKALAVALARAAAARNRSESDLIREGISKVVQPEEGIDMQALIGADLGVVHGPRDLSSNRKRLSGYGRARNR